MKNGSESVVPVRVADVVSERLEYPNKPAVPSVVSQWQRKAVSLVDDAWQGVASALLAPFCVQQRVLVKAVSKPPVFNELYPDKRYLNKRYLNKLYLNKLYPNKK